LNSPRILIIEDELLIQRSLKKMLEKKGAVVDAFSSGREAIPVLLSKDYDRIVCDLMLQDVTGFDVIEEAKQKYSLKEIGSLFIIITAYSSQQVLDKAAQYGCQVLSKPFEDLERALDIFLCTKEKSEL
jgi:CheY-like chemotaxis protein